MEYVHSVVSRMHSSLACLSPPRHSGGTMRLFQLVRAFFTADFNRLAAHLDLDRIGIQCAIASCTSLHNHDTLHARNSGIDSRPLERRVSLSESLATLRRGEIRIGYSLDLE